MYSLIDEVEGRVLIVYLTRTNNTEAMARIIKEQVGGDLVEIELVNPYPEDYQAHVDQVVEENNRGFLPPLKTKINMDDYDVVFVGFPTWGMQLPPPMKTFLSENDFSGKRVIPFNTNAGFGVGSGFRKVKELCPDAQVLEGLSLEGGYEKQGVFLTIKGERAREVKKEVETWLQKINIIKE
ncbi:flavodoxin [Muricauda sp. NBRC 101325]|nr:flavodoxin [Muricauda sp. NBRC 101325]